MITPAGKLALKDLVSEETHLVFPKYQLERDIGQTLVELALRTGILTQVKAPGLSYQQRVSVNFFHKSIQEFMAALVVCGNKQEFDVLCQNCTTVDKVMELSNMIVFVCGLNPVVGSQLSEHVKRVINADTDILQYRESPDYYKRIQGQIKVDELYKMQCRFFSEMKCSHAHTCDRDQIQNVLTPDIFLDRGSGSDMIEMTKNLLSVENNDILSVYLDSGYRKTDHALPIIPNLPNCKDLAFLHISGNEYMDYTVELRSTLQKLAQLKCLYLSDISLTDSVALNDIPKLHTVTMSRVNPEHRILPSLWFCSKLKQIKLEKMTLIDGVTLTRMAPLETVSLYDVRCAHFMIQCLPGCTHLTSLDIDFLHSIKDRMILASVLPRLVHLQYIKYCVIIPGLRRYDHAAGDVAVVVALKQLSELKCIDLEGVYKSITFLDFQTGISSRCSHEVDPDCEYGKTNLKSYPWFDSDNNEDIENGESGPCDDGTLQVTSQMKQLEDFKLTRIRMSPKRWSVFVNSLLNVQHTVNVTLCDTDIDTQTVSMINKSPHFKVLDGHMSDRWYRNTDMAFSKLPTPANLA